MNAEKQVKSRERVAEHGEVFTNEREVKAMCDMIPQECDRLDSRFLEPACGEGNFLAVIVERKLATVKRLYKNSVYDYERYSALVMSSVYGVDILNDNVKVCRKRLFLLWDKEYKAICKKSCTNDMRNAIKYILEKNILCGNALTLMQVDDACNDTSQPIIFPEWSLIGAKLKRRDFRLDVLLKANDKPKKKNEPQLSLFEEDSVKDKYLATNPITGEYMPLPIREYPPTLIKRVVDYY